MRDGKRTGSGQRINSWSEPMNPPAYPSLRHPLASGMFGTTPPPLPGTAGALRLDPLKKAPDDFQIVISAVPQRIRSRWTTQLWSRWKTRRRRQFLHRFQPQPRLGRHRFRLCVHRLRLHRRVYRLQLRRLRDHRVRIYLRRRVAVAESEMMASGTSRHTL